MWWISGRNFQIRVSFSSIGKKKAESFQGIRKPSSERCLPRISKGFCPKERQLVIVRRLRALNTCKFNLCMCRWCACRHRRDDISIYQCTGQGSARICRLNLISSSRLVSTNAIGNTCRLSRPNCVHPRNGCNRMQEFGFYLADASSLDKTLPRYKVNTFLNSATTRTFPLGSASP
jgi:hypothetical protein